MTGKARRVLSWPLLAPCGWPRTGLILADGRFNNLSALAGASGGTVRTPDGHLRSDHWHVANGCNGNIPSLMVFEAVSSNIGLFRRYQCQSPILARRPSMPS